MDDGVTPRLLLVSHCLLNPYSAVKGRRTPKETARFAVMAAVRAGVGLMQLPCPEYTHEGPDRWAKTYQQYDTGPYRRHCRELVRPLLEQLREYVVDGARLVGVIGVEGSPSCGAYQVGSGEDWGGCFDDDPGGAAWRPPPSGKVTGRGIFLAALADALEGEGWETPVIAVPKDAAAPEVLERFRAAVDLMVSERGLEGGVDDETAGEHDGPGGISADVGDQEDWG